MNSSHRSRKFHAGKTRSVHPRRKAPVAPPSFFPPPATTAEEDNGASLTTGRIVVARVPSLRFALRVLESPHLTAFEVVNHLADVHSSDVYIQEVNFVPVVRFKYSRGVLLHDASPMMLSPASAGRGVDEEAAAGPAASSSIPPTVDEDAAGEPFLTVYLSRVFKQSDHPLPSVFAEVPTFLGDGVPPRGPTRGLDVEAYAWVDAVGGEQEDDAGQGARAIAPVYSSGASSSSRAASSSSRGRYGSSASGRYSSEDDLGPSTEEAPGGATRSRITRSKMLLPRAGAQNTRMLRNLARVHEFCDWFRLPSRVRTVLQGVVRNFLGETIFSAGPFAIVARLQGVRQLPGTTSSTDIVLCGTRKYHETVGGRPGELPFRPETMYEQHQSRLPPEYRDQFSQGSRNRRQLNRMLAEMSAIGAEVVLPVEGDLPLAAPGAGPPPRADGVDFGYDRLRPARSSGSGRAQEERRCQKIRQTLMNLGANHDLAEGHSTSGSEEAESSPAASVGAMNVVDVELLESP